MIDARFHLEPAHWSNENDQARLRAVREVVFVVEQKIPPEEEWDALDTSSHHVLAIAENDEPIGCGRLTPDNHIGRMAVLKSWRGHQVGAAIFQHLLDLARSLRRPEIILHAQSYAVPFYAKFGFATEGEEFIECDIPHVLMRLNLRANDSSKNSEGDAINDLSNAADTVINPLPPSTRIAALQKYDTAATASDAIEQIAQDARHRLWIYAHRLDHLLHRPDLIERIKTIALSGRQAHVHVLVHDPSSAVRDGHPLLHLKRKLPSFIDIRVPSRDEELMYPSAYVINDSNGYAFRTVAARFEGEMDRDGGARQRQLLHHFEEVWQRAIVPPDLHHVPL